MNSKFLLTSAAVVTASVVFCASAQAAEQQQVVAAAPAWALAALDELSAQGLLPRTGKGAYAAGDFSRTQAAAETAKAAARLQKWQLDGKLQAAAMTAEEQPPVLRPRTDWTKEEQLLKKLEQELTPELDALGFFKTEQLYQRSRAGASPQRPAIDKRLKIAGTVRYHYVTNSGDRRVNFDDSRLRARVYYDYNIDNNWHAHTMTESDRTLKGDSDKSGTIGVERGYVDGDIGVTRWTAGSFGYLLGDGNIYDSRYDGVRVFVPGPVQYTFATGRSDYFDSSFLWTAHYDDYDYSLDAGIHRFDLDVGGNNTIMNFGGTYQFENFSLGAMYLHSTLDGGDGYVLTLAKGELKPWVAGTQRGWIKYYNQAAGTYIAHTMYGLADYLNGFKGYGVGYSRAVRENLVTDIEYYDIKDKTTNEHSRTLWIDLVYYFSASW